MWECHRYSNIKKTEKHFLLYAIFQGLTLFRRASAEVNWKYFNHCSLNQTCSALLKSHKINKSLYKKQKILSSTLIFPFWHKANSYRSSPGLSTLTSSLKSVCSRHTNGWQTHKRLHLRGWYYNNFGLPRA